MDRKSAPRSSLLTGYPHFLTVATSFSRAAKWPRFRIVPPVLGYPRDTPPFPVRLACSVLGYPPLGPRDH